MGCCEFRSVPQRFLTKAATILWRLFFMVTPRTTLRPKDQKANRQIIEARLCGLYAYPRNKRPQVAENRRFRYHAEIAGDLPPK